MAVCKRCGKKGLFLHVNADGLCKKCIGQQEALLAGKKKAFRTRLLKKYYGSEYQI